MNVNFDEILNLLRALILYFPSLALLTINTHEFTDTLKFKQIFIVLSLAVRNLGAFVRQSISSAKLIENLR